MPSASEAETMRLQLLSDRSLMERIRQVRPKLGVFLLALILTGHAGAGASGRIESEPISRVTASDCPFTKSSLSAKGAKYRSFVGARLSM